MTEVKGTEHLKKLLDLVMAMVSAGVDAEKDGHLGVEDLGLLLKIVPTVGAAVEGVGEIPSEISDLSAEEAADLTAYVMAKLVIDDAKAQAVIGKSLKLLVAGYDLVKEIKA